jgi:hypothetical protein
MSDDSNVMGRIEALVAEEHTLFDKESHGQLTEEEHRRLRDVEESLDQCWDLLRQRRAKRAAGLDPDETGPRDVQTVEHYQQ